MRASTMCLMYHIHHPRIITAHKRILQAHCCREGYNRLMGYPILSNRLQLQTSALRRLANSQLDIHILCLHRLRDLLNYQDMVLSERRNHNRQECR